MKATERKPLLSNMEVGLITAVVGLILFVLLVVLPAL
jgi:hypothetical protein